MPRAFRAMILSSKPGNRRRYLAIKAGANRPCRSRGIDSVSSPSGVRTVLGRLYVLRLPLTFISPTELLQALTNSGNFHTPHGQLLAAPVRRDAELGSGHIL